MRRTFPDSRAAWRAPAIVLGPLALAALATGAGADAALLGPLWLAALAWTVLASLTGALGRALRHGDRSAFGGDRLPHGPDDGLDMDTRTGMYAYLRDEEDRLLHDG
ncbi:MAG: hypothetical protein OXO52_20840 [Rhodospirillales bacterium]|nr:hypothetical protein [Rhodospirillales bacterium]MDE0380737.1 hypothetical protein [Rhodospirillales bacterium]